MKNNPFIVLTFLDDNSTVNIGKEYITSGSVVFDYKLLKGLDPASNRVNFQLIKDCPAIEKIITSKKDVKLRLTLVKEDGTLAKQLFTGYLSNKFNWGVNEHGKTVLNLSAEDVGTRLLKKSYTGEHTKILKGKATDIINALCKDAGITRADNITIDKEVCFVVDTDKTYEDVLKSLIKEVLFTYYFDEYGKLALESLAINSTDNYTIDKNSLYAKSGKAIDLTKSVKQYGSVEVKWKEFETKTNSLIFKDTNGRDDKHPNCYIPIKGGGFYPAKENGKPANIEVTDLETGKDVVFFERANPEVQTIGDISYSIKPYNYKSLSVLLTNNSGIEGHVINLECRGDLTVVKSENSATAGDLGFETFKTESDWIHNVADAKAYAEYLANYYKYCNQSYKFYSTKNMKLGDVCRLKDETFSGLNTRILLTAKKWTLDGIYEYSGVGVEEFDIKEVTNVTINKPSISPSGLPGPQGPAGPAGPSGKPVPSIAISVDKTQVEFYADNVPLDENEEITVSVKEIGIDQDIKVTWGETGNATVIKPEGIVKIPVRYLKGTNILDIKATCDKYSASVSVSKQMRNGELTLRLDDTLFDFYADDVPHNVNDKITVTVESKGYYQNPKFYLDGQEIALADPKNGTYQIDVNHLIGRNFSTVTYENSVTSKAMSIGKAVDNGVLTLTSDKDVFNYYADNVIMNTAEKITLNIAQSGFSRMPDLYVNGSKKTYSGSTYVLTPDLLQNQTSLNCYITIKTFRDDLTIRKVMAMPSIDLVIDNPVIDFTIDNVALLDKTKARVTYSGLFNLPKLLVDNKEVLLSKDGIAEISTESLKTKSVIVVKAIAARVVTTETQALITKNVIDLHLGFDMSSTQFIYDKDGNAQPDNIVITNTTTGLNDPSLVTLMVGKDVKNWVNGKFTITPDMVPDRYTVVTIGYGKETTSAIIVNTYDGQDGLPGEPGQPGKPGPAGPKGENAGGVYLGAYNSAPSTRVDGSKIEDGDYYLNISNPASPLPYRWKTDKWYLVTESDKDWSKIASDTMGDVTKWNGEILSTSAYYGFFTMLAAQKAFIREIASNKIVLNKEGEIVSDNYESSGGTEGFRLAANGDVEFNKGTWRGSFANGLVFNAPTKCEIKKTMTQKEAYRIMKEAGIGKGEYNGRGITRNKFQEPMINKAVGVSPFNAITYPAFSCLDYDTTRVDCNIPIRLLGKRKDLLYEYEEYNDQGNPIKKYKYAHVYETPFGLCAAIIPFTFTSYIMIIMKEITPPESSAGPKQYFDLDGYYVLNKTGLETLMNTPADSIPDIIRLYNRYSSNQQTEYYAKMRELCGVFKVEEMLPYALTSLTDELVFYVYPVTTNHKSIILVDAGAPYVIAGIYTDINKEVKSPADFNIIQINLPTDIEHPYIAPLAPLMNVQGDGDVIKLTITGNNPATNMKLKAFFELNIETDLVSTQEPRIFDSTPKEVGTRITADFAASIQEAVTVNNKQFAIITKPGAFAFEEVTGGVERMIPNDKVLWKNIDENSDLPYPNNSISNMFVKDGNIYASINGTVFRYEVATDKFFDMTFDIASVYYAEISSGDTFDNSVRKTNLIGTSLTAVYPVQHFGDDIIFKSDAVISSIYWDNKENAVMFNYKSRFITRDDPNKLHGSGDYTVEPSDSLICVPIFYKPDTSKYKVFAMATNLYRDMSAPYSRFSLLSDATRRVFVSDSNVIFMNGIKLNSKVKHFQNYPIDEMKDHLPGFYNPGPSISGTPPNYLTVLQDFTNNNIATFFMQSAYASLGPQMRDLDRGLKSYGFMINTSSFDIDSVYPFFCRKIIVREDKDKLQLLAPMIVACSNDYTYYEMKFDTDQVTTGDLEGFIKCQDMEPFLTIRKDSNEPVGATFVWEFPAQLTVTEEVGQVVNMITPSWDIMDNFYLKGNGGSNIDMTEIQRMIDEAVRKNLSEVATALDEVNGEKK